MRKLLATTSKMWLSTACECVHFMTPATWSDPHDGVFGAEALLQSLQSTEAEGKAFALTSTEGQGPGSDRQKWQTLFEAI